MVSDARICIRRAELSDARIRSRKQKAEMVPDAREVVDALQVSDARRHPAKEATRYTQLPHRRKGGCRRIRGGGRIDR